VPVYDYTCAKCGQLTEVIHGIHDGGPRFCPACGAEGLMRKGFATPAVHFKGSGWAKKDRAASQTAARSRSAKPAGETGAADGKAADGKAASSDGGGPGGADGSSSSTTTQAPASTDGGE
jgi:putative FmdB family regulatory protein